MNNPDYGFDVSNYGTPIVLMQFGSHVYGTNTPSSDKDYKAIHIPKARDIVLGYAQETLNTCTKIGTGRNTAEDVDFESFSLKKYLKLLLEGQTVALNMLFTPEEWIIKSSPTWEKLVENREKFLHKGVSAFVGYCRQQANKYGIKGSRIATVRRARDLFSDLVFKWGATSKVAGFWDTLIAELSGLEHVEFYTDEVSKARMANICNRKIQEHITLKEALKIYSRVFDEYGQRALQAETDQGIDWKALMHAVRVCGEAIELLRDGVITYPRPEADLLLSIRTGSMTYKEVSMFIERGMEMLLSAEDTSKLPSKPDYGFAERFVYRAYLDKIESECLGDGSVYD